MWAMYRCDGMSEDSTQTTSTHRLEPDYEEVRWKAVFTAECGFFSANRLKRLFSASPLVDAMRANVAVGGALDFERVQTIVQP